jgi:hypothetical protein
LREKSREFVEQGADVYAKREPRRNRAAWTMRDRRESPRGREYREEFESMQEKRKEFVESGAEVYAKK